MANDASDIALVANGPLSDLSQIETCHYVIAVDSGLTVCQHHGIKVTHLIGDLDSIRNETLENLADVEVRKLDRAKDQVDLEAGLHLAQELDPMARPLVFNAIGGRSDHHLNNLYLLYRFPEARLVTDEAEIETGVNFSSDDGEIGLTLFAFYGPVKLQLGDRVHTLEPGDSLPVQERCRVISGMPLKVFSPNRPAVEVIIPSPLRPHSSTETAEEVHCLSAMQPSLTLAAEPGLTISLIPWLGPVKNVRTKGLKWNLNGQEINWQFIGISNVAKDDQVEISIETGSLLCIIQRDLIDKEMLALQDHTSTGKYTSCVDA